MADLDPAPLAAFLQAELGDPTLRVAGHARLSGGASRETFAVDVVGQDGPRALVLQRVRAGALSATFSMEAEARLLRAAATHGVAVAPVVAATDDPAVAGAAVLVMARVGGEAIARRILRDDDYAEARRRLVGQCADALAAIHRIPLAEVGHLRPQDPLDASVALLDSLGEPHPAFELALRWLRANRPPPRPPAVVHGDFRLGNLLVDADGLAAVLDWELAHVGDPLEDLGWFCTRAWRFGGAEPVAGLGPYDELLDGYAAAGGAPVDLPALRWWETVGCLRWGAICILQAHTHLSGASRSVELATIGRRVCETEHDLLDLLGVPAALPAGDRPTPAAPGLHGRPTAAELAEAVREHLERDVLDATSGRVQFHTRVAVNALRMLERELQLGPGQAVAHAARLAALGFDDDAALAAAIRAGALDDRLDEVAASVRADVADKLAVANPGYAPMA